MEKVKPDIIKLLAKPKPLSHKGDNGRLLIVGGSKRFHGAPLLAAKIASKIVDLVFFYSTPENQKLLQKMKEDLAEFITVLPGELDSYAQEADCILIGPGLGYDNPETKEVTDHLLKKFSDTKFLIDADSLKVVDPALFNKNVVVTPHVKEFEILFKEKPTPEKVAAMAKKWRIVILLKGKTDFICSPTECKINETGNAGMTKGGTGDVLAGLVAALMCKNDNFLSACAGAYLNGLAGDRLKEKVGFWYSASDLIEEIPLALKWCEGLG